MIAFFTFPVLALFTVWLLSRWTSLRTLPIYVTIPLFLAFFIPVSIVALVPSDLVDDNTLDYNARLLMWRLIYWISFALMWLVLPVLQAYVESGYYEPVDRLKDALRYTLKYHLIMLAVGVAGIVYMGISEGLSISSLKALCVALSHSYGLVLVIWMLGHGMVEIPRNMWQATVEARLSKLYRHATYVHDTYADAQSSYDDVVAKIMALEPIKTAKYTAWIDGLVAEIRDQDLPLSRSAASRAQPRDLSPENVASLSRRFHRDLSRTLRARADWTKLLKDVEYYEKLSKNSRSGESSSSNSTNKWVTTLEDVGRPFAVRIAAIFIVMLSITITWSELVSGTQLSLVDLIVKGAAPGMKFILAAVFLGYMCFCVNSSLTSMRIFNLYAIVPKHTDASSLLFFAAYALRLTVPLSYNFLTLNSTQETVFQEFLGKFINLTALGKYFNQLLPRLIVLPIAMSLFNFYEIVKDYLGFGLGLDYFGDTDDLEAGSALVAVEADGRGLVRRALQEFNGANGVSGSPSASRLGSAAPTSSVHLDGPANPEEEGLLNKFKSWFG